MMNGTNMKASSVRGGRWYGQKMTSDIPENRPLGVSAEPLIPRVLRLANPEDVPLMVGLRGELFRDLARQGSATRPSETAQEGWQEEAVKVILDQLQQPDHHYLVMEAENAGAISGWGMATVIHQIPGPGFPTGRMGLLSGVVVDPAWRGRGIGSTISRELLQWLATQKVEVVDLLASNDAAAMYRNLGFTEPVSTALRYLVPENPDGG